MTFDAYLYPSKYVLGVYMVYSYPSDGAIGSTVWAEPRLVQGILILGSRQENVSRHPRFQNYRGYP